MARLIKRPIVPFCYGKMPVQKTLAIVIRFFPLRESDKIITFYTADFGKIKAVARGVRRPKSRLAGGLELLNYGTLVFFERPNKDLQTVNDFDLISSFEGIKADFDRTTYGCYLAELIGAIESDHSVNQRIFHLLQHGFETLTHVHDIALFARAFELQLLGLAGYAPQLSHCVACAHVFHDATLHFSSRFGGLLCVGCRDRDASALSISRGSCQLMRQLQKSSLSRLGRFRASVLNHRELKFVLATFVSYCTERDLKSLKFIDSLNM